MNFKKMKFNQFSHKEACLVEVYLENQAFSVEQV